MKVIDLKRYQKESPKKANDVIATLIRSGSLAHAAFAEFRRENFSNATPEERLGLGVFLLHSGIQEINSLEGHFIDDVHQSAEDIQYMISSILKSLAWN